MLTRILIIGISLVFSVLMSNPALVHAQTPSTLSDSQKYQNGYRDGLKSSQQAVTNGHACDPTISLTISKSGHSIPYQNGYTAGYNRGPCGSEAEGKSTSSSTIPGLIF
jgi:hypothetical protein